MLQEQVRSLVYERDQKDELNRGLVDKIQSLGDIVLAQSKEAMVGWRA